MTKKLSAPLLESLAKTLESDSDERSKLIAKIKAGARTSFRTGNSAMHADRLQSLLQGIVVFKIDGEDWTLDLREGKGTLTKGGPEDKADLTLTIGDENFAKLVMGKLGPQQVTVGCR